MTEYQLRIYHMKPGTMAEFVAGWRKRIVPIREQLGFKVLYAFEHEQNNEFIWLLSYEGPDGYAAADARYYASDARKSLNWDTTQYIERMELRLLQNIPL